MSGERRTALYDTHLRAGARMVPFAGWTMPVSYSGVIEEHRAVRTAAGLFDVSHMGEILIEGSGALDLIRTLTLNDASALSDGEAQYSAMTTPEGTLVDDLLVYRFGADRFMMVVNAATREKDLAWIRDHPHPSARVADVSDRTSLVAVQGPRAVTITAAVTGRDVSEIPRFGFIEASFAGCSGTLSRTGYTGEDGFEFYFPREHSEAVWNRLMQAGENVGLRPAGLGARNTLRLEAGMLLYGQDIDDETTALEAGLGWMFRSRIDTWIGSPALAREALSGPARRVVGFQMQGREIAREGYPVRLDGAEVGQVTSGAPSISLGVNIGLARLPASASGVGTPFEVRVRRRWCDARVVTTPFYRRGEQNES
jgi:glycine cleavage system T protein (aminomethyltransferase)